MFQPQATPYAASFSSYGPGASGNSYPGLFQASAAGGVIDHTGPTIFEHRTFPPSLGAASYNHHQQQQRQQRMYKMSEHDMQAQELAAQNYERENRIEGPMVGERKSSHAITEEYAKADPIYVAKTIALPQKYSHYRPIAGDGNCGWRAAGFSYFECLLKSQSRSQLEEETARITSLNNILTTVGGLEQWLAEDMTEETMTLFQDLTEVVEESPASAAEILLNRFNDSAISLSIIYHLRLLASAWLAGNPDEYAGFIPDGFGVAGYRKNCLEPVNTEIEHLGMTLLIDVLLKPIGITVEIVMLDRSEGSQANSHIFQSEDPNGLPTNPGGPMIHLLYRPSHYDILYKDLFPITEQQIKAQMDQYSNVQVNRAHSLPQLQLQRTNEMGHFSPIDMTSPLLDIPGYSLPLLHQPHGYQSQYQQPLDQSYTHSPMSTSISPILPSTTLSSPASSSLSSSYAQQQTSHPLLPNNNVQSYHGGSTQLPIHTSHMTTTPSHRSPMTTSSLAHRPSVTTTQSPTIKQELTTPVSTPNSFRPSHYQYAAAATDWHEPVLCQTSTFKNSHFNTAHYLNPDFQPEEWTPDSEEAAVGSARTKST